MQASTPPLGAPVTTAIEHERLVDFPSGLHDTIIDLAKSRSIFLRGQSDYQESDGVSGGPQVPEHLANLWLVCVWCSNKRLRATENVTVAAYLKVRFKSLFSSIARIRHRGEITPRGHR